MTIRIDGGTVVGWSGEHHELIPDGSVYIDGDTISNVGKDRTKQADRVIDASDKLVCPGFINLHVHSQLNIGDYLLTDVGKKDYMTANYFVFGAPAKDKPSPFTPEGVAIGRKYALFSALKNGSTTILDPGSGPGNFDDYVEIVGSIGGRAFFSPSFRSHDIFTDGAGHHSYEARPDGGRPGLQATVDFIRKHNGAHNGRMLGILNPGQAETCEPSLLKETATAAKELGVGVHIHAGGNLREVVYILYNHRKTVLEYLADAGILQPETILGHCVLTADHSRLERPFTDELKMLSESGASVGHCAYKYAKMALAMESFDRFLDAGINVGLGTDTYPLDIVSELRYASVISRLVDKKYNGAPPARVFNAATVWGANALGRDDLGRLAPGAKADITIINQRSTRYGPVRDPITALVEYGCGADVETVLVNGDVVIDGGHSSKIDEEDLYGRANAAANRAWDNWSKRDWAGRSVEEIIPPAFPTRS